MSFLNRFSKQVVDASHVRDFNLPVKRCGDCNLYTNLHDDDLHQYVNKPTRDNTILILIFSTTKTLVSDVNVCPVFSSSDHGIITFNINVKIGPLTKGLGNHTNDENEMATILINLFASVFTDK